MKRLASSLVVLRKKKSSILGDKFEVLLIQRSKKLKFASTWVFPGGVYDRADGNGVEDGLSFAEDVDVLRQICIRETFEETGVLPLNKQTASRVSRNLISWKTWREKARENPQRTIPFLCTPPVSAGA